LRNELSLTLISIISLLSTIGTYAPQASVLHLRVMLGFGVVGYFLRRFDYPLAPMVIGAVLVERALATILAIDLAHPRTHLVRRGAGARFAPGCRLGA
jgi:TctA family transporter